MSDETMLFEKQPNGLLTQIDPVLADAARASRHWSRIVNHTIDVLFTDAEEAQIQADAKAKDEADAQAIADAKAQQEADALAATDKAQMRVAVLARLKITEEEAKSILG